MGVLFCFADDSVEKTIQTYRKLVKDGIQPEKPVPFFSEHGIFRRSLDSQNYLSKRKRLKQKLDAAEPEGMSPQALNPFFTAQTQLHRREADPKTGGRGTILILFARFLLTASNCLLSIPANVTGKCYMKKSTQNY